ncbi:MAG TPA: hypothetical protein VEZ24_02910 [Microvirga sp.]|nr:hypothetical protein [Microvirga sp.]
MLAFMPFDQTLVWIATRDEKRARLVGMPPASRRNVDRTLAAAGIKKSEILSKLTAACAAGHIQVRGTLVEPDGSEVPLTAVPTMVWKWIRLHGENDENLGRSYAITLERNGQRFIWHSLEYDVLGLRNAFPPSQSLAPEKSEISSPLAEQTAGEDAEPSGSQPQPSPSRRKKAKSKQEAIARISRELWPDTNGLCPLALRKEGKRQVQAQYEVENGQDSVNFKTIERAWAAMEKGEM